ncbi:MAG: glyceraldehyde-3-phosphate dehydrogenase [Pseudomonadales bacterium]|nr:glyceraldehyde-3-phosphate dehydrogenase [Pseudomonadales bacterium]
MGFGQTGRQLYELASRSDDIEIVAIADIGAPKILHYLLCAEVNQPERHTLEGNFLANPKFKTRLMAIDRPAAMPWDAFDVDVVIDATGKYREANHMQAHLDNGAPRVILRSLPVDSIDRIVVPGVNAETATLSDRMISAGSATTSALCLLLKILSSSFDIECASMTSVHANTSDQALQDYAGSDMRRSRSAAENIIPNTHEAHLWLHELLPAFSDKVLTYVLNVPIHEGCLLDTNIVLKDSSVTADDINQAMRNASAEAGYEGIVGYTDDPIVSSDVIGSSLSLLFDTKGTVKAGSQTIKTLSWYENIGHAARLLDVVRLYAALQSKQEAA